MTKVEFKPPAGLEMPEGKTDGDTVELMAEFQIKKNGDLCLVSIEDNPMPGYADKDNDEGDSKGMPEGQFMAKYREGMAGQMGQMA